MMDQVINKNNNTDTIITQAAVAAVVNNNTIIITASDNDYLDVVKYCWLYIKLTFYSFFVCLLPLFVPFFYNSA